MTGHHHSLSEKIISQSGCCFSVRSYINGTESSLIPILRSENLACALTASVITRVKVSHAWFRAHVSSHAFPAKTTAWGSSSMHELSLFSMLLCCMRTRLIQSSDE